MKNCTYCNKPIYLNPTAAERAKTYGQPASHYTNLFTSHSDCLIAARNREASELMASKPGKTLADLKDDQMRANWEYEQQQLKGN